MAGSAMSRLIPSSDGIDCRSAIATECPAISKAQVADLGLHRNGVYCTNVGASRILDDIPRQ
jgi:hypothetical protein